MKPNEMCESNEWARCELVPIMAIAMTAYK